MSMLLFLGFLLLIGHNNVNALSYDYTATIECLAKPYKPLYNGGIILNPELNDGLKGWSTFGGAQVEHRELQGNKFIVAYNRTQPYHSTSQKLYLEKDKLYAFSAWIQVGEGRSNAVRAVFKTRNGHIHAGGVMAESNCWSMLKGGLTVDESGPAELYFQTKNTSIEVRVDSISLQPFTQEQWTSHQHQSIEKVRKSKVRIQVKDKEGKPLQNANISLSQKRLAFPFGCAINKNILSNTAYQNWFTSRFTVATFEDEMKWYSTEGAGWGKVDYSIPDAMLQFAKKHGVAVRGHNVFWDSPQEQPKWVPSLSTKDLWKAVTQRINSVMSRYRGQLIHWDVVNENLHFNFFESRLGKNASSILYNMASKINSGTTLFMNEFNTIEDSRDGVSVPASYLQKLREIESYKGSPSRIGIGLESHFSTPNIPYVRASLDTLGSRGMPLWLTELDVAGSNQPQARYLEQIIREARAHPFVGGIVLWAAWKPSGCYRMCLTDNNFRNLPTGDVVDKLLHEWGGRTPTVGTTDGAGTFEATLFHGHYVVTVGHSNSTNITFDHKIQVTPNAVDDHVFIVTV